jgi:hypothetical protein
MPQNCVILGREAALPTGRTSNASKTRKATREEPMRRDTMHRKKTGENTQRGRGFPVITHMVGPRCSMVFLPHSGKTKTPTISNHG